MTMPVKLMLAFALLCALLLTSLSAARMGPVEVGAGEVSILLSAAENGLALDIGARSCPPQCGFEVNWRPLAR